MRYRTPGFCTWLARAVAAGLFALAAAAPATGALPERLIAVYELSYGNLTLGTVETTLRRNGQGEYETSTETQANLVARTLIGTSLTESGAFHLVDGEIRSLRYAVVREGRSASVDSAVFDWHRREVHFNDGRVEPMPAAGVIDINSLLYAYMLEPPRDLQGSHIHVVDGRHIRQMVYGAMRRATVETGVGKMEAVRVQQSRVDSPDRSLVLWMAPELGHLPVRIENNRDGRIVTLVLQSVEGL
jgi:hypothetical protein